MLRLQKYNVPNAVLLRTSLRDQRRILQINNDIDVVSFYFIRNKERTWLRNGKNRSIM